MTQGELVRKSIMELFLQNNVTGALAQNILDCIRKFNPHVPTTIRGLLKDSGMCVPRFLEQGVYYHIGLKENLQPYLDSWVDYGTFRHIGLQINYDGLSISNSSSQQLWPFLGRITTPYELPLDMVKSFPLEPMHLIYPGVVKKLVFLRQGLAARREKQMDNEIVADNNNGLQHCFGNGHIVYNIHSLKHRADNVELHEPLEEFSAFHFESYMRKIRQPVHCGYAVAKQAAQRYVEHVYLMKSTGVKHVPKEAGTKCVEFCKGKLTYLNTIFTPYSPDNVILAL
ncbi:unnamed protein product, partial [Trichobilharzia regenti]